MKGSAVMEKYDGDHAEKPLRQTVRFESWDGAAEVERQLLAARTGSSSSILDIRFRHDSGEPATIRVEVLAVPVESTSAGMIYPCVRTPAGDEINEVSILIPTGGMGNALITIAH